MSSALEIYQRHCRRQLAIGGYAVWPPGRALQLGDVVTLGRGGDLRKQTDLRQLGLELTPEQGRAQTISVSSERVRQAAARAGAALPQLGKGLFDLRLGDKGAVVFEARGFQHLQIGNLAEIRRGIVDLHRKGAWEKSWCLVDQLWWVETGTIIVSETDDAEITIAVEGLGDAALLAALADPNIHASVEVKGGSVAKILGGRDFAAMFTGMRLDFWKADLKPVSTRGSEGEAEPQLIRISLDEVEDAWRSADGD